MFIFVEQDIDVTMTVWCVCVRHICHNDSLVYVRACVCVRHSCHNKCVCVCGGGGGHSCHNDSSVHV